MKRIALDRRAFNGLVEKAQIECGVVTDQDRTLAAVVPHGFADIAEHALQGIPFVDRRTQRVIRVDAVDGQRCRIEIGTFEGLDVETDRRTTFELPGVAKFDQHGGDLEQCISLGIEATGLDIDDDRQKAAETFGH